MQENEERFHNCLLELLSILKAVGEFDHRSTPTSLKQALATLYHNLKQYLKDKNIKIHSDSKEQAASNVVSITEKCICSVHGKPTTKVKESLPNVKDKSCNTTESSLLFPNEPETFSIPVTCDDIVERLEMKPLLVENDRAFPSLGKGAESDSGLSSEKSSTNSPESPKRNEDSLDCTNGEDHSNSPCIKLCDSVSVCDDISPEESSPILPVNITTSEGESIMPYPKFPAKRPASLSMLQNFLGMISRGGDEFCASNVVQINVADNKHYLPVPLASTPVMKVTADEGRSDMDQRDSGINVDSLKPDLRLLGLTEAAVEDLASPVELLECALARIRGARTLYH